MSMLVIEDVMKIRPSPNFGSMLSREGIRRSDLAKNAGLSAQTIQRMVNPEIYRKNDKGNVSDVSARRIAKAYASMTGSTADAAYALLFVEVEDEETEQ